MTNKKKPISTKDLATLLETKVIECSNYDCKFNKMIYKWVHKEERKPRCMFKNIAIGKTHECRNFEQKENLSE